jgi:hypothetical protein
MGVYRGEPWFRDPNQPGWAPAAQSYPPPHTSQYQQRAHVFVPVHQAEPSAYEADPAYTVHAGQNGHRAVIDALVS